MHRNLGKKTKLIVGLGNPGLEYENTRHNVGFMVVDEILSIMSGSYQQVHRYNSLIWEGRCKGNSIFFQKPLTFMNLSGDAVVKLYRKLTLTPEEVLVIYDDLDLPYGEVRIKKQGGAGGHNGMLSIIKNLESENFPRLRIGIGRDKSVSQQSDFVLSEFLDEDSKNKIVKTAAEAGKLLFIRGIDFSMNKYNNNNILNES